MVLGATPQQIHAMVFWQVIRLVALGIAIGLVAAVVLVRVLGHYLSGMAAALVATTSAAACWIPVWRATRVDSVVAIRQE